MTEIVVLRFFFWMMFCLFVFTCVLLGRVQGFSRESLQGWQRTTEELTSRNQALWIALNGLAKLMRYGGAAGEEAARVLEQAVRLLDDQLTTGEEKENHADRNSA